MKKHSTIFILSLALVSSGSSFGLFYYYEAYVKPYKLMKRSIKFNDFETGYKIFDQLDEQLKKDDETNGLSAADHAAIKKHIGKSIRDIIDGGFSNVVSDIKPQRSPSPDYAAETKVRAESQYAPIRRSTKVVVRFAQHAACQSQQARPAKK